MIAINNCKILCEEEIRNYEMRSRENYIQKKQAVIFWDLDQIELPEFDMTMIP